jgi:hypothetical protein
MTKKEIEIKETIKKLSRQLGVDSSEHSLVHANFLQQAIEDLENQLIELREQNIGQSLES